MKSKRYLLVDGERRFRAALLAGQKELNAIVLRERPTPAKLRIVQFCSDAHRSNHRAMERSDALAKIKVENGFSVTELAQTLNLRQPLVTKLLAFQKLCPAVRDLLHSGDLDSDKAYAISQEPDPARQMTLAKDAKLLSRENLRRKTHSKGQHFEAKASIARFPLPAGVKVTIQRPAMTLASAIESLMALVKTLKKAEADRLDISTAQRVLADRARQPSTPLERTGQ